VFPTPARAVLGAIDHRDACERSATTCGRKLSVQAFNLLPRIAELDRVMSPPLQARVAEAHPELAFARLAGAPMAHPKRTEQGRHERRAALARAGLADLPDSLPGAAADDIADAAVLALVAAAVVAGRAEHIGDGARDARGLRMEIVSLANDPGGLR
jgi:predicted RNase H-like nuclease